MTGYTKEHLEAALMWLERSLPEGEQLVAHALAATDPDRGPPLDPMVLVAVMAIAPKTVAKRRELVEERVRRLGGTVTWRNL